MGCTNLNCVDAVFDTWWETAGHVLDSYYCKGENKRYDISMDGLENQEKGFTTNAVKNLLDAIYWTYRIV